MGYAMMGEISLNVHWLKKLTGTIFTEGLDGDPERERDTQKEVADERNHFGLSLTFDHQ